MTTLSAIVRGAARLILSPPGQLPRSVLQHQSRGQGGVPSFCGQVEGQACGKRKSKSLKYCKKENKVEVVQKCRRKKSRLGGHPRP
ncbi:hypothetical protein J6590_074869 [Homalodisca vitripennis]|nr:hypothetical protein J6590_074869 [Homalodisca vitripennis]